MSSAAPVRGASEALATFIVTPHRGDGNARALDAARALLAQVNAALERAAHERTARDGDAVPPPRRAVEVSYGPAMRDAFEAVIALGGTSVERGDAAIVSAARAAAALRGAEDETTVRAIAVGRETAARLARALALDPAWDDGVICARIGAAAAAACAAGCDAGQARDAIGIAATQAAGLRVARGTPAATAEFAKIAPDSLEAAVLASHGFTAAPAPIEGRRGLAALMASAFDANAFTGELGQRWLSAGA